MWNSYDGQCGYIGWRISRLGNSRRPGVSSKVKHTLHTHIIHPPYINIYTMPYLLRILKSILKSPHCTVPILNTSDSKESNMARECLLSGLSFYISLSILSNKGKVSRSYRVKRASIIRLTDPVQPIESALLLGQTKTHLCLT